MQDNFLIFGGGNLQLSLISQIKEMGYNSIVIDPDENAPAKSIADNFFVVKGDDFPTTLKIAKENNVRGIVTTATDKPILMMCRIAENLKLKFPSYYSCEILLDKWKFKNFLMKNKLPHAYGREYNVKTGIELNDFNYPVIVKPVMNSGSRGVIKCNVKKELSNAIKECLKFSSDGRCLIEEYIEGEEISVEAVVQNSKLHIIQITDKIVTPPPYNVEIGHIQPSKFEYLKSKIYEMLQIVIDKSGINNCAIHPELKIKGDEIKIIEVGPRLGGDFITSSLVPLSTGINIEKLLINISLGIPIEYKPHYNSAIISYFNFPAGKVVKNSITKEIINKNYPNICSFYFNLKPGEKIPRITNSFDRYGFFIIAGKDIFDLLKLRENIIKFIETKIFN